ncbi:hypothetical protein DFH06DRAFT_1145083 [Mycena polygramma]|nr:hypothetical protein DFH06DRAFT_1145083 [Mycena polygramma]
MSIPPPARAGRLLCPCRSTYFMVSAHEGRREPQAHTDLCICEHKYDNHIFLYVPDPANPSPANIKGPNRAQQCGWFIPPRLPIQPTMPCKGCNTPWYHHDDVDMPAMPSTSGPILPQASYPPSDTFLPHIMPRASHPPPNTFPPPSSYLPPPATAYRSTVAPPHVEYHTPNPIPESYQPPVPDRGTVQAMRDRSRFANLPQHSVQRPSPPSATATGRGAARRCPAVSSTVAVASSSSAGNNPFSTAGSSTGSSQASRTYLICLLPFCHGDYEDPLRASPVYRFFTLTQTRPLLRALALHDFSFELTLTIGQKDVWPVLNKAIKAWVLQHGLVLHPAREQPL